MNPLGFVLLFALLFAVPTTAEPCTSTPLVTEVYPTSGLLPENLLRFYLYFSEPMQRRDAQRHIQLETEDGQLVPGAFLSNKTDLWSPDGRRLTVLFDPGRVKTGLVAHNTMGRALRAGLSYALVVGPELSAQSGCPLGSAYRKAFRVGEADFEPPDPSRWEVTPPAAAGTDPLRVALNGAHDHASLAYRLRVVDSEDRVLPGRIELQDAETIWLFTPDQPWLETTYSLNVDARLEDIAGNSVAGSFERPKAAAQLDNEVVSIRFTPGVADLPR